MIWNAHVSKGRKWSHFHAGLSKASQESPTQRSLPSRSNCALLCLKLRNAKNSICDFTRVNRKTNNSCFFFWAPQWKAASLSALHWLGDHSKSGGIKLAISKLANIYVHTYIKWHQIKDTEVKLLLRGWSPLPLAVQGTFLHRPSFIRQT